MIERKKHQPIKGAGKKSPHGILRQCATIFSSNPHRLTNGQNNRWKKRYIEAAHCPKMQLQNFGAEQNQMK